MILRSVPSGTPTSRPRAQGGARLRRVAPHRAEPHGAARSARAARTSRRVRRARLGLVPPEHAGKLVNPRMSPLPHPAPELGSTEVETETEAEAEAETETEAEAEAEAETETETETETEAETEAEAEAEAGAEAEAEAPPRSVVAIERISTMLPDTLSWRPSRCTRC